MSLVAYDNSDDSDSSESEDAVDQNDQIKSTVSLPPANSSLKVTATERDEKKSIFSCLPKPKSSLKESIIIEDELTEPVNSDSQNSTSGKRKNEPVKIYLQPLSEFTDTDVKNKTPRNVSKSGSGLFSVLPPPKNTPGKTASRILLPHSLKGRDSKTTTKVKGSNEEEIEVDSNEDTKDFFGLQSAKDQQLPERFAKLAAKDISLKSFSSVPNLNPEVPEDIPHSSSFETSLEQNAPTLDVSKVQRIDELYQDEEFVRFRGKKRNFEEESEIIDVSQDEQMPSWEERTKLISQEDENVQVKGPQPSAQHRKKHQITYLAYQAQARELELKNQWAQNRFTKQQTRAKYGF